MKKFLLFSILGFNCLYSQNLVKNGGFENWTENIPDNWTITNSVSKNNVDFIEGNTSLELKCYITPPYYLYCGQAEQNINGLIDGKSYHIKFSFKYTGERIQFKTPGIDLIHNNGPLYDNSWVTYEKDFTYNAIEGISPIFKVIYSGSSATSFALIDEFQITENNTLGSTEVKGKTSIFAFPNPTNRILNITNPNNGANKIEILDTNGKLVANKSFRSSENTILVDVEHLQKGIYIYKIGKLSSKFIKN